jgi:hypothetical protein
LGEPGLDVEEAVVEGCAVGAMSDALGFDIEEGDATVGAAVAFGIEALRAAVNIASITPSLTPLERRVLTVEDERSKSVLLRLMSAVISESVRCHFAI